VGGQHEEEVYIYI